MDLSAIDPFSEAFLADPYPAFARLRDEAPVHYVASRKMWMVTRFDDVVAVARNHAVFSSTGGVGYDWNQRPMMPMYDPPEHTRMRRIVARHFTPGYIGKLAPRVEALARSLVEAAVAKGSIDLVHDVALPFSLGTIAELLGVPAADRGRLRRWAQGTIDDLAGGLAGSTARKVDELRREFNVFLRSLIEERRAAVKRDGGGTDIISLLVAASEDDKLTAQELVAFCVLLMVAGHETTANAISNGVLALLDHPEQAALLRANPALVPAFVEEAVRYDSPVLSFFRNTLDEVTLAGVRIPKGEKVMIAFSSANRDPRKFVDPDVFRIERHPTDHLGYGIGVHYCLGAVLARLELATITRAILEHTSAVERSGQERRWASVLFRGVRELPVRMLAKSGASAARAPVAPPESDPTLGRMPSTAVPMRCEDFQIHVEDSVLDDLRGRLERTRWPDQIDWAGWDYGSELGYMKELVAYWLGSFDWRAQERALNALPHRRAQVGELTIHFVHVRAANTTKPPLLVLHGWPGPFREFSRIIDPLTKAEDGGFDLVIASLPGFPFSSAPRERGMGTMRMAEVMKRLMAGLGYERYGIVAEDWGAGVASRMAFTDPEHVIGIHLNMPHENPPRGQMRSLSVEERDWLRQMGPVRDKELTHFPIFQRRPQSIAYGLNDSPVGLAALLVEKYRAWSDCDGDVEKRFTKDDLLTNVMLYWATGSIASSLRVYFESKQLPWWLGEGERIEVPTAIALTKKEFVQPPRAWIERIYDLRRLTHLPAGGHFAAWEEPAAYAEDIRAFFGGDLRAVAK